MRANRACAICQGPARPSGLCHYCEGALDDMDKAVEDARDGLHEAQVTRGERCAKCYKTLPHPNGDECPNCEPDDE